MSSTHCSSSTEYPDGPVDVITDVAHLSDAEKTSRLNTYIRWYQRGGRITTAAGKTLLFNLQSDGNVKASRLRWKVDGQVSIAKVACQLCKEINTLRPKCTPPFVCLVRAQPGQTREDGTTPCAYCHCLANTAPCRAQGGTTFQKGRNTSEETWTTEKDTSTDDLTPVARKKTRISYLCDDEEVQSDATFVQEHHQKKRHDRITRRSSLKAVPQAGKSQRPSSSCQDSQGALLNVQPKGITSDDIAASVEVYVGPSATKANAESNIDDARLIDDHLMRVDRVAWLQMQETVRSLTEKCKVLSDQQEEMRKKMDAISCISGTSTSSKVILSQEDLEKAQYEAVLLAAEEVLASKQEILVIKRDRLESIQSVPHQSRKASLG